MEKGIKKADSLIEKSIYVIVTAIVLFIAICAFSLPSERQSNLFSCDPLDLSWTCTLPDGSSREITLPAKLDVERGEKITISSVLPETFGDNSFSRWLCFRSLKQDMEFYIDGEKRGGYSTADTRLWGKYSASGYIFIPLTAADYGKPITVTLSSVSGYSGNIDSAYSGTVFGIWYKLSNTAIYEIISAILLLVMAIASIVISIALGLRSGSRFYLGYLGWSILLLSVWIFSQSSIRQLFTSNMSLASDINYLAFYLFPIPAVMFINYVQNRRHKKLYQPVIAAGLIFFAVAVVLQVTKIADFNEVLTIMHILCIVDVVSCIISVVLDIKSGDIKEYSLVIYGFIGFAISAMLQLVVYVINSTVLTSTFICSGALFMLIMAGIDTVQDYIRRRKEVDENLEKAEKLTYQAMETLVHTIEAKDEYTKGHSTRVAEYSKMLAEKAGLSEEEQNSIFYMATLHDIGKIGIADSIINKQGKLTDDEYAIIKTHPETGFDILRNMNEVKDIEYGARWHHERFDGKGYPDGLKGEEIPLYARIIAVADTYDAMTSDRSYRKSLGQEEVAAELKRVSGTQLDPIIAKYMIEIIDSDRYFQLRQQPKKR